MKLFRSISVSQRRTPADLYESICSLYPTSRKSDFFFLEAKPGDEESGRLVERVLALCKEQGLKETRGETVGSYVYGLVRIYDAVDLKEAPLLLLLIQRKMFQDADQRDAAGRLWLPATKAKSSVKVGSIYPKPWIVVSDSVRRTLESGNLASLAFGEVCIKGKSIHGSREPFWELKSHLSLPKMVNSVPFRDSPVETYGIEDEPYRYGEPHYRRSELEKVGSFDIAQTFERLGMREHALVVSQRFYRYCLQNKIRLEAMPARIDPE